MKNIPQFLFLGLFVTGIHFSLAADAPLKSGIERAYFDESVKPGQDLTAPLRSRLAARCHRQRFGRRTTRVAVEGLARFAFIGDRHNGARIARAHHSSVA